MASDLWGRSVSRRGLLRLKHVEQRSQSCLGIRDSVYGLCQCGNATLVLPLDENQTWFLLPSSRPHGCLMIDPSASGNFSKMKDVAPHSPPLGCGPPNTAAKSAQGAGTKGQTLPKTTASLGLQCPGILLRPSSLRTSCCSLLLGLEKSL